MNYRMQRIGVVILSLILFTTEFALIAACLPEDDQIVKQEKPIEATPGEPKRSRPDPLGFCDDPTNSSVGIHSSMAAIARFSEEVKRTPRKLSAAQCIAIAAYAKTFDQSGESCADRGVDGATAWIRDCYRSDWAKESSTESNNCQPLGHHDSGVFQSSQVMREYLRNNVTDCMWSTQRMREIVNQNIIESAIKFLHRQDFI